MVHIDPEHADEALATAVREKLCWKDSGRAAFAEFDQMTKAWVSQRRRAIESELEVPAPPHVALLTLFSLAAERIGEANADTGAVESSYYANLERVLGVPPAESSRVRTSFAKSSETYWESLSLWLEDYEGQRGMPSAYSLMHRYVGLPVSQALVRDRERRNLKKMFAEQGFVPGMTVSHADMYGAIDVWVNSARTSANTALVKMWSSAEVKDRVVEVALAEFSTWEGAGARADKPAKAEKREQRCLLTVRDARVMLRSEVRFGLLTGSSSAPGEACCVELLDGETVEFRLERVGVNSAGFDFRSAGLDVGSALDGELRITIGEQNHRRFPKKVVIFTRDAFSAAYVESDRINAAMTSRILVRDEPLLVAAVEKVLADAAQPGFTRSAAGRDGLPDGWNLFKDVVLLRAPSPSLLSGPELSAFQPRLSTQMTITGGLKMPGHMQRWSALSPIQVAIASESDEPVDLVVLTRNTETLLTDERFLHRELPVPAVVDLDEMPEDVQDFTLSLRRGKKTLQNLTVKLRSSESTGHEISRSFRSLCHDLDSSLWPIQTVASADATAPGVDGLSISAPTINCETRTVSRRPNWNQAGVLRPNARPLVVRGPAQDSCILTGRHRFSFPTFDGKRPKSRWMYGDCQQCGMSKRQPTWPQKNKVGPAVAELSRAALLPSLAPAAADWSALIDTLFFLGTGSRRDFSVLARQLEDSAAFEYQLLRDLEALGVIELERNEQLEVVHWETAATCIAELGDGSWLLTGYWEIPIAHEALELMEEAGAEVTNTGPQRQNMYLIRGLSHLDMSPIAEQLDVKLVLHASRALAEVLPPLSSVNSGLLRASMPFADRYEYFDVQAASWRSSEAASLPGLYRVSREFNGCYYFRNARDLAHGTAARVPVELGKHLAALELQHPLIAFNSKDNTLSVPMGAELPGLYGRAAVMGTGDLPLQRRADRSVNYLNVPPSAAEAIIGKITS